MLIARVIPCLLMSEGAMLKTRRFGKPTYLGDPVNVINLFNQFEVDEIVLLDVTASQAHRPPDFALIEQLAEECWVPLTYGGGLRSVSDIEKVILAGVEKVVVGTAAAENPSFVTEAAKEFGTQCIVGSVDAKRRFLGGYEARFRHAAQNLKIAPETWARRLEAAGAGEILLQSIDRDGEMVGYDLDLISVVAQAVDIPVVACGGAGKRQDLVSAIAQAGASAAAAGSIFVFSGRERGVLINFPERALLEGLLQQKAEARSP